MPAQKITSYTISQNLNFSSWVLESSNNGTNWTILHTGFQTFSGRQSFDIVNHTYYLYYRVRVTHWVPGAIREIGEVEFFTKSSDTTTQSTTYTTTTTYTSTTGISTSGSTTFTTRTTITTGSTTILPPCMQPGYVVIVEADVGYNIEWEDVPGASAYEIEVCYNDDMAFQPLDSSGTNSYALSSISSSVSKIQFRVRTNCGLAVSNWTPSADLTIRKPLVDFIATAGSQSSQTQLKLANIGTTVTFTDLSTSQGSPIISRAWKFYSTPSVSSSFTTSSAQNPTKTYSAIGVFAVSLTVTDERGMSSTLTKTNFILVGCDLIAGFSAGILDGPPREDSLTVQPLQTILFEDLTTGGTVRSWSWKFYSDTFGMGSYIESTLRSPPFQYQQVGTYAVGLSVVGSYRQVGEILKPNFIHVVVQAQSSSTTGSTTTGSTTATSTTITETTTSPPVNWLRVSINGHAIANSFKLGFEPYKAFDEDTDTMWEPDISAGLIQSTFTTTISTTASTTENPFLASEKPGPLWQRTVDVKFFRDRFIELATSDNIYRIIRFNQLPRYVALLHDGTMVYDNATEKFYVGADNKWIAVNPMEVLHAWTHGSGGSDQFFVASPQPPINPFVGEIWIDSSADSSTETTASTTQTSTTAYNGNIAVPGPWGYGSASSFSEGHPYSLALDSNDATYWEAANIISTTEATTYLVEVNSRSLSTPPSSPSVGDREIVGSDSTGAWAEKELQIAEWNGATWSFTVPVMGDYCYIADENNTFVFSGSIWQPKAEWIGFYWTERRIVKVYRVFRLRGQGIPSSWTLQASRNGLVWMEIHSVRDSWTDLSEYDISNSTDFNYYRLYIDETNDGRPPRLASLEFFEGPPRE